MSDLQPDYAKPSWASEVEQLERRIDELEDALRYLYMWISPAQLSEDEDTALVEARRICWEALQMARCEFEPETFWLNLTEALTYDCVKCGDGDALREGEPCAYCGCIRDEEGA